MKLFFLILYVSTPCHEWPEQQFVVDSGLSESDCIEMQSSWIETINTEISYALCIEDKAAE
jgi:hypothetical protein